MWKTTKEKTIVEIGVFVGSDLEDELARQLDEAGLKYVRQFKFHDKRRWKADFAFPDEMVLVEVQGGTWSGGRHTRGGGFHADRERCNEAQIAGWLVLEVTAGMVKDGDALEFINRALIKRRE